MITTFIAGCVSAHTCRLTLADDGYLSGSVDGITGATLSVRATEKVARLALWLDAQVRTIRNSLVAQYCLATL